MAAPPPPSPRPPPSHAGVPPSIPSPSLAVTALPLTPAHVPVLSAAPRLPSARAPVPATAHVPVLAAGVVEEDAVALPAKDHLLPSQDPLTLRHDSRFFNTPNSLMDLQENLLGKNLLP